MTAAYVKAMRKDNDCVFRRNRIKLRLKPIFICRRKIFRSPQHIEHNKMNRAAVDTVIKGRTFSSVKIISKSAGSIYCSIVIAHHKPYRNIRNKHIQVAACLLVYIKSVATLSNVAEDKECIIFILFYLPEN